MEERLDSRGLTEAEAIARYKSKNYPKPAMTADVVVFSQSGSELKVLLIERGGHPFIGKLALPGGFANENEPVEHTAARELEEETGVSGLPMELVGVFSRPGRDPRGWVISAAFVSVVNDDAVSIRAGDDASDAQWYTVISDAPDLVLSRNGKLIPAEELAFDHAEIMTAALRVLKALH